MNKHYDILIFGSGPTGIHAATVAAQYGAKVGLVDMSRSPGGRVLKTTEDGITLKHTTKAEGKTANTLENLFKNYKKQIDYYPASTVVDLVDNQAVIDGVRGQLHLSGQAIILAPGAVEAPALFKNWTTPGIYTLGGYNSLIKRGHLRSSSVLVAGSGPLLYAMAVNAAQAGITIKGFLDGASFLQNAELGYRLARGLYGDKMQIALRALPLLLRTKWKRRCRIQSVEGEVGNFTVRTVYMDKNWRKLKDGPVFNVENIAVSYGMHPNTDLSRRCECFHSYNPLYGTWSTVVDSFMRTSTPGVYAAGDAVEIKGYEGACNDGRLAGLAAVYDLGLNTNIENEILKLQKIRRSYQEFSTTLTACSEPGNGYFDELDNDIVVCRCEGITIKNIRTAFAEGARDRNGVKRRTRLGMGNCQGRYCGQVIDRILNRLAGSSHVPEQFTPRTPMLPVRMGILAGQEMPVGEEFRP